MLCFDQRIFFMTAARVFAGEGFQYHWRTELPLLPESLEYVNDWISRIGSPVMQRKNRKTGRSELFIPDTSRDYAAVCADRECNCLNVIVLSRDPRPLLKDMNVSDAVNIGRPYCLKRKEMMTRLENGRMEPRQILTINASRHTVEALTHASLRAIETQELRAFRIFRRMLDEIFCLAPQKFSRILPAFLCMAWQKTFRQNPPEPMTFSGEAPDLRESLLCACPRENFSSYVNAARESIAGEREILLRFFENNPAETYECDNPALTCGHGALGKGFVSAYNSLLNAKTRDPAEDPALLTAQIESIRKKCLLETDCEELFPEQ